MSSIYAVLLLVLTNGITLSLLWLSLIQQDKCDIRILEIFNSLRKWKKLDDFSLRLWFNQKYFNECSNKDCCG